MSLQGIARWMLYAASITLILRVGFILAGSDSLSVAEVEDREKRNDAVLTSQQGDHDCSSSQGTFPHFITVRPHPVASYPFGLPSGPRMDWSCRVIVVTFFLLFLTTSTSTSTSTSSFCCGYSSYSCSSCSRSFVFTSSPCG